MIANIVGLLVLVALIVLFAWLTRRAWGSKHRILKWPALILSGLLTLVLALATVVALIGLVKTNAPAGNPVASIKVAGTSEQIARGQKFALYCAGCHSTTGQLPLDGGKDNFGDIPGGPSLGTIYAPNLTPAGEVKDWSDGELVRAIREGVHKSRRPLIVMPSENFHNLSDDDVQAIVAYLRSQPPVKNSPMADTPSNGGNLLAALILGTGMFPTSVQPPITQPVASPPPGVNAENGKYLVSVLDCHTCHGANLTGGKSNGLGIPVGPNLTVLVPNWSEADFVKTIRTGVDPTGHALNPDAMPWKEISSFATDDELKALYAYLHTLTPAEAKK